MAEFVDQTITGSHIVDGQAYVNVQFRNATLVYTGGQPPAFSECRFDATTFSFEGPAAQTLQFLNAMAPRPTNMRDVVLGLLPALKD